MGEPDTTQRPSKSWVFTLNNYTENECNNICLWECNKICVTKEVGAEGTPHLQGYVTFKRAMRLSACKKLLDRAHWEVALVADWNYNLKGDSIVLVCRDNTAPGKRNDVATAYEYIRAKKSRVDYCSEQQPGYQCLKLFELASGILAGPRPIGGVDVRWYCGPAGSGKTRAAYDEFPDLYSVPCYKWWNGYHGQQVVLIDDFRPDWCRFSDLLRLIDIYPVQVEFKGGMAHLQARIIIITCPLSPAEAFVEIEEAEELTQLTRRLSEIRVFPQTVVPVIDLTLDHE